MWSMLALALLLSGCAISQSVDVDMCTGLLPGHSRVMEVRAASPMAGTKAKTWPWVRQHALVSKRAAEAPYACTTELEAPSTADAMSILSSPASSLWNKINVPAPKTVKAVFRVVFVYQLTVPPWIVRVAGLPALTFATPLLCVIAVQLLFSSSVPPVLTMVVDSVTPAPQRTSASLCTLDM